VKRLLTILSWIGLALSILLVLVGVGTIGVLAAARLSVAPAVNLLRIAAASAAPPVAAPVEKREELETPSRGIMYTTGERVLNLADRGGMRYLKVQVVLEFAPSGDRNKGGTLDPETYKKKQEELRQELLGRAAMIDDQITTILSSKTSTELMTVEGKTRLKQEIKERIAELLPEKQLMNVYFTQFVIQ